jgi:hypothetical protein
VDVGYELILVHVVFVHWTFCRMENFEDNFHDWQFPLSATLGDIESQLVAQMPYAPPRTQPTCTPLQEPQDTQIPCMINVASGLRKGEAKRMTQRGKTFSKEEDMIIYFAFLNVSKDPVTGN